MNDMVNNTYSSLDEILEIERKTLLKVNDLEGDEQGLVRSLESAHAILKVLSEIDEKLNIFFGSFPNFKRRFDVEFGPISRLQKKITILDICFIDDFIFPGTEHFALQDYINKDVLEGYLDEIIDWIESVGESHKATQETLKEHFYIDQKINELPCQCIDCVSLHRTKIREAIYAQCSEIIDSGAEQIQGGLLEDIDRAASSFFDIKKQCEKMVYKARFRLKRSSLNRLEGQIRNRMKKTFNYPSELAVERVESVKLYFKELLRRENLRTDLIEDEYDRFFTQLHSNIWRNCQYLEREFKKLVRSVLLIKRKDISATILMDYLGTFWIHSDARRISRKIVYHMGPTNSGKTYHAIQRLSKASSGSYLAPLRLLAGELFDTMNSMGTKTTLLTGEEVIEIDGATHYSSTIEMAKLQHRFECCVIDEIQMISDSQRGWAWTRALVGMQADEIHVCGDQSAYDLVKKISDLCGDTLEVKNYERMCALEVEKKAVVLGDLQKSDALIVFSRKKALEYKYNLEQLGFRVSIIYGRLSPEVRREQARKFDELETDIIVSTDAIAMGMNLPIRRIIFSTLSKFIDSQEIKISNSDIKQIAGRCGRFNRYPTGYVTCLQRVDGGLPRIIEAISKDLDQKKLCMVGPDLEIFNKVNSALQINNLPLLRLSEFLRLFNTMTFEKPFFCVDLKDMIEIAEMVEDADAQGTLSSAETFGFTCAPVNLGLVEHVQYYVSILSHYVSGQLITNEEIDSSSKQIDYLETSIKCVELYQWLSRHFKGNNFDFLEEDLLNNKKQAIHQLNELLSDRIIPSCSSCGKKLPEDSKFQICESCFKSRKFNRRGPPRPKRRRR